MRLVTSGLTACLVGHVTRLRDLTGYARSTVGDFVAVPVVRRVHVSAARQLPCECGHQSVQFSRSSGAPRQTRNTCMASLSAASLHGRAWPFQRVAPLPPVVPGPGPACAASCARATPAPTHQ